MSAETAERRRRVREATDALKTSGVLDGLLEQVDARVPLTGADGLLGEVVKAVLERGLEVELTDHVGYERGDAQASLFPNSRNGTFGKTVTTEVGDVELSIPRDRLGTFAPQLIPKGVRRVGGLPDMIVSLYAGGMTVRDIAHHLERTVGTSLSPDTISKITDAVADEVAAWQRRPLDPLYPVIFMAAIVVKVRDGGHIGNRAAHLAVGVDTTIASTSTSKPLPPRRLHKPLDRLSSRGIMTSPRTRKRDVTTPVLFGGERPHTSRPRQCLPERPSPAPTASPFDRSCVSVRLAGVPGAAAPMTSVKTDYPPTI